MSGIIHSRRIFTSAASAGGGSGTTINVVPNYGELPDPTTVSGQFYWCSDPSGIYLTGLYYSNGTTWEFNSADDIIVVANYSALPAASSATGQFYWCSASQGTAWLPGSLGGTYYSAGLYYSNGTTWEYLNVPYEATQLEVDTGTVTDKFITPYTLYNATRDFIQFDTAAPGTPGVGKIAWDTTNGTLQFYVLGGNYNLPIGQSVIARAVNKTTGNLNLLGSNYQVVKIAGATGQKLSFDLAQGNNDVNSAETLGVVLENINNNQEGFLMILGQIIDINTTGSLQGETWNDGDQLYLSPTTPGALTKVKPVAPDHTVAIAYVEYAHVNHGKLFVKIQNGYELGELHDVYAPSPSNNQVLTWVNANNRYEIKSIPTSITIACSDETTALTTGTAKTTFRMPYAMTLTEVRASLTTAQSAGSIFTVDINEAGTSILSTKLTIDNTEKTSTTAATPAVISDTALADDAEITIDIDQIGTSGATGLKVTLIGTRV